MSYFLFKRVLTLIATLLATSVIVFAVLEVLPGNAAQVLMGPDADPAAVAAKATELGLDQPALQRYFGWMGGLLRGDMGLSYTYGSPVSELIVERLALTIPLAVLAMLLTTVIALAVGVYAASRHNSAGDVGLMTLAQIGIAIPNFWFAILLILLFSVKLQWFSAGGFDGWYFDDGVWRGLWDGLRALILPAIALAVVQAAILARFTRSAVLEVLREDFVRTARAKGLSHRATLWGHVLRRHDPRHHRDGPAVRRVAGRHHRGRERVLPARSGAAHLPVDCQPRPDRGAQLRDAAGSHGGGGQFCGRSALCSH